MDTPLRNVTSRAQCFCMPPGSSVHLGTGTADTPTMESRPDQLRQKNLTYLVSLDSKKHKLCFCKQFISVACSQNPMALEDSKTAINFIQNRYLQDADSTKNHELTFIAKSMLILLEGIYLQVLKHWARGEYRLQAPGKPKKLRSLQVPPPNPHGSIVYENKIIYNFN